MDHISKLSQTEDLRISRSKNYGNHNSYGQIYCDLFWVTQFHGAYGVPPIFNMAIKPSIIDPFSVYCEEIEVWKAKVYPSGRVLENTVVTVKCSKSYAPIPHKEVTCQSGGKWSTQPKCKKSGMKSVSRYIS